MLGAAASGLTQERLRPRAFGLGFSARQLVEHWNRGRRSGLELAVTGASALVAAACGGWIQHDEACCSGRLGRQFMKRKFFGAADSQKIRFPRPHEMNAELRQTLCIADFSSP